MKYKTKKYDKVTANVISDVHFLFPSSKGSATPDYFVPPSDTINVAKLYPIAYSIPFL